MSWSAAVPAALAALAWVVLPGLTIGCAIGVRGLAALATAPVLSIAATASTAVLAGALHIRWSPVVAAGGALVIAVSALLVTLVVRRWRAAGPSEHGDGWRTAVAAMVGLAGSAIASTVTAMSGMGSPDALSQTYDAVFHYNAVAEILGSGNASSLAVGTLTNPAAAAAFYPAAWHDLVSLVVLTSGTSIALASNVVALVVAAVAWPLSCLLLVRQLVGRCALAALVTPVVAVGFIAFPWNLMTFGVVWPNLVGIALLPAALAAVITVCGLARDNVLSRGRALVLGAGSVAALGLAHPNAVFSLAALSAFPFLWWLVSAVRTLVTRRRWIIAGTMVLVPAAVAAAVAYLLIASPLLATVRAFNWPAYQTAPQAVGEVLLNATNLRGAAWPLSLVVLVGAVVASRSARTGWLVPAHLVSALLFVVASSLETPLAAALTGLWYNDPNRLAAVLPVTAVPLAVLGLFGIGAALARRLQRVAAAPGAVAGIGHRARTGVLTAAVAAVLIVTSGGLYVRDHADDLAAAYRPIPTAEFDGSAETNQLLGRSQREFMMRIAALIPPDAVVAQNPWSGSALLWSLTGREVLFPHLDGTWTADQDYLAGNLEKAATNPRVCAVAAEHRVHYVLIGPLQFWPWDLRRYRYISLDTVATAPGFTQIAADQTGFRLYRITACDEPGTGSSP